MAATSRELPHTSWPQGKTMSAAISALLRSSRLFKTNIDRFDDHHPGRKPRHSPATGRRPATLRLSACNCAVQ